MTGYSGDLIYVHDPGFNIDYYNINDVVQAGSYTYVGP